MTLPDLLEAEIEETKATIEANNQLVKMPVDTSSEYVKRCLSRLG